MISFLIQSFSFINEHKHAQFNKSAKLSLSKTFFSSYVVKIEKNDFIG